MLMIGMFITVTFVYGVAFSTVKPKRMLRALRIITVGKEMRHERGQVRPCFTWVVFAAWIGWLVYAFLSLPSMWASRKTARDLKVMMSIML